MCAVAVSAFFTDCGAFDVSVRLNPSHLFHHYYVITYLSVPLLLDIYCFAFSYK